MNSNYEKFKNLLNEMFQLDQADLDFGIYKIMNYKRAEINKFLDEDLLPQVTGELEKYTNIDRKSIEKELAALTERLNSDGVGLENSSRYLELKGNLDNAFNISAVENEIYSYLTSFFKRYYNNGDFLSLRRYKKDVYAIPYEGEEVKLHWANADQYYIKTAEHFKNYAFTTLEGQKVHFKLIEAETEKDNNKGKERRFSIFKENPFAIENDEFVVHFEFDVNEKSQKVLTEEAIREISDAIASNPDYQVFESLLVLDGTEKNPKRTLLEKRINDYTARNTFDYFIHKNLGAFLKRELDFFIKNEILFIDNIDSENEVKIEQYIMKAKVLKRIAGKIITFLDQIESFQKKLWLKKKFVTETNYCMTIDKVDEEFYPEIFSNQLQIDEWIELYSIDEISGDATTTAFSIPLTEKFLKQNQYLVIDTANFTEDFKERLISKIDNIDEQIDGVLIHSENFQALNLLQERYKNQINQIYIDPPYNAKSSEILYKNNFKHSSWASFMENRLRIAKSLLNESATTTVAIDENENLNLGFILNNLFRDHINTCVTVIHNPGGIQGKNFSYTHEYAYFIHPDKGVYIGTTTRGEGEATPLRDWGGEESKRGSAANCFYPIFVKDNELSFGDVCDVDFHPDEAVETLEDGSLVIYPVDSNGVERKWRFARDTVETIKDELKCETVSGEWTIRRYKTEYRFKTVWTDKKYNANTQGSSMLGKILGGKHFDYPKSLYTVQDSILAVIPQTEIPIVLDFFAGSGTTGHAVIDMQRNNLGNRKYILIEMGDHFDTVVLKRMKKVIYSEKWKKGKPQDRTGVSQIFKYLRLESYEDTLNNLKLMTTDEQLSLLEEYPEIREQYMLSYMLSNETEKSMSLLNIAQFKNPFSYKMNILTGLETQPKVIDLIETFNYLLGLKIMKSYVKESFDIKEENMEGSKVTSLVSSKNGEYQFKRILGNTVEGTQTLIIWRTLSDNIEKDNAALNAYFEKIKLELKDFSYEAIYVNGDNNLYNLKTEEEHWQVALTEEEFKKRMFDVLDV